MPRFERSVVIDRPPEQVFAFLANPENDPQWSSASQEMRKTSEGPIGVGTTFEQTNIFLGRRFKLSLEVTSYEAEKQFGMKVTSGPFKFAGIRVVEAAGSGTRVTLRGGGRSGGFFRMAEPLLERAAARELEADLTAMKEVIESPATPEQADARPDQDAGA
jgi:uncharacterized protein YndB with AHSA1/START domain